MKLFKRKPPNPFTWKQRLTGEATVALQDKDISKLRTLSSLMESLEKPPLHINHPLQDISKQLKHKLKSHDQGSFLKNIIKLEEFLEEDSARIKEIFKDYPLDDEAIALAPEKYAQFQTSLRLVNLQYYCKNLKESSQYGEQQGADAVGPEHAKYVIDSFLLGSGAERTAGIGRIFSLSLSLSGLDLLFCFNTTFF
mgnify:FL=1